ncbi:hypothetical protein PanWU01x14_282370 [Parasponia andersonii]|uniref:Transmembrane protein n=1 Tax=Parasponia andersonii TaxID=3476 RepID=A0A2P5B0R7_PARAD|nr:hypothetical protein PanWU01x14_282370 [Parasponia andersonii]
MEIFGVPFMDNSLELFDCQIKFCSKQFELFIFTLQISIDKYQTLHSICMSATTTQISQGVIFLNHPHATDFQIISLFLFYVLSIFFYLLIVLLCLFFFSSINRLPFSGSS